MSKARDTLSSAGAGAAIGTAFAPGVGTAIGAGVGGLYGYFAHADAPDFQPPELQPGQEFSHTYNPHAYTGQFDPRGGATGLRSVEDELGIQGFDGSGYMADTVGGLRAQVDEDTRRRTASASDAAMSRGLGNSGTARALEQEAGMYGDRTLALGTSAIRGDMTQIQQAENARRTGSALGIAGTNLQNEQFGAGFNDGQARHLSGLDLSTQQLNEGQRQHDNAVNYGVYLDDFQQNQVNPYLMDQQFVGSTTQAGLDIVGGQREAAAAAKKPGVTG